MNITSRDSIIKDRYENGDNCRLIGEDVGLTTVRVTQIAKSLGCKGRVYEPSYGEVGWMVCKVRECNIVVRSRWGTLCNTHYFRGRRTGTVEDRKKAGPYLTSHGYLASHCKGHPASSKTGFLYEHRKVFYENYGKDNHTCYWCKEELVWGSMGKTKLVIDHLDGDKENNNIVNLKASCARCNTSRGLFMSWLAKHGDDPILRAMYMAEFNKR